MDDSDASAEAVVDYCQTQARLLAGQVETLGTEIDTLLDEIDDEASDVRDRLERSAGVSASTNRTETASSETAIESLEAKQATVAQKQARRDEISDLASGYLDLTETLQDSDVDETDAIERVLEFEAERDAHTFFEERTTLLETAAGQ